MYLFLFLWVPSHQAAGGSELPLGYIFSSFMISMMLGSIVYTTISSTATITSPSNLPPDGRTDGSSTNKPSADSILVLHAKLASLICACAALSLAYTASFQPNSTGIAVASRKFWAFCLFEACVGAYYPVMGMLRGAFVPNEVRATVRFAFSYDDSQFWFCLLKSFYTVVLSLPCPSEHLCYWSSGHMRFLSPPPWPGR